MLSLSSSWLQRNGGLAVDLVLCLLSDLQHFRNGFDVSMKHIYLSIEWPDTIDKQKAGKTNKRKRGSQYTNVKRIAARLYYFLF